jgi:hypothetical protein
VGEVVVVEFHERFLPGELNSARIRQVACSATRKSTKLRIFALGRRVGSISASQ